MQYKNYTSLLVCLIMLMSVSELKAQSIQDYLKNHAVTTDYYGVKITDAYRGLENMEAPEVVNWFKQQEQSTQAYFGQLKGQEQLISKMEEFDNRKSVSIYNLTILDNNMYYYLKSLPGEDLEKLYTRNGLHGEEELLFDPSQYSEEKKITIGSFTASPKGSYVTIKITADGAEKGHLLILKTKNKTFLKEKIDRIWFAPISWLEDESGFFYNRINEGSENQSTAYFHKLNKDVKNDKPVFSSASYPQLNIAPTDFPVVRYNKSNNYLFMNLYNVDQRSHVYYADKFSLNDGEKINWKPMFKPENNIHGFEAKGCCVYARSSNDSPNFKLIQLSLCDLDVSRAKTIVPESKDMILSSFVVTKDNIYFTRSQNGVQEKLYTLIENEIKTIELPNLAGKIRLSNKGVEFNDIWVNISGWTTENERYKYVDGKFLSEQLTTPVKYPEYENLQVEEVMVTSHDGVKVPLSLIYQKAMIRNSSNPTMLYGYGAYGHSMNPFFSPALLLWVQQGGILAIPHVRGGGELGNEWHKAGLKTTKHNTWKDLIACTEYLIKEKYTSSNNVAIRGGSAAGILIGRAMTERPDLFAVVIAEVGVMNPLRMEATPNGPANAPEFGTIQDSIECMALIKSDSYLALKNNVKYPATLLTAGMNDPRVVAWQPGKFIARLQEANTSDKPAIFHVDFEGGHGMGATKSKRYEKMANILSFAFKHTDHPAY